MDKFSTNGGSQLAEYETPFADSTFIREEELQDEAAYSYSNQFLSEFESPFSQTYEVPVTGESTSPAAGEFVQFLSELHDTEFPNTLYEMAAELEQTWSSRISNEAAMGDRFLPFATQQANEYFAPLTYETGRMIDQVSEHFSGNNFGDHSEAAIERFFNEFEYNSSQFSPAQEQFFGGILKKVTSVVKTGINLAKKGISIVGKLLPINVVLNKLKGLLKPLLEKVLKFAIGKLPEKLRPFAQTFASKFLKLGTPAPAQPEENEIPSAGNLQAVQAEFDSEVANLVFSGNETEAQDFVLEYETSMDSLQREINYETGGINLPSLNEGRQQLINELKELNEGESAAPAIERFLPVAIMALKPIVKMALKIIGRQKVINFLAGLLAKLVGKYVPENVAQPLAASIIDVGMSAIGFEAYETNKTDVAYEAIANTIQETIQNLGTLNEEALEETLNDQETLTAHILEAFETAAGNNFPSQYIKEEARPATQPGLWVLKPRQGPRHFYKKYTHVFTATITPPIAKKLTTFRDVPLANFLRDKLGLDPDKPIQARVHLYEAIQGTRLSQINHYEKVPGLGPSHPHGGVQFHPLTHEAAAILCKEPGLGKKFSSEFTTRRHHTAIGQRFYYLEINGARLRIVASRKTATKSDSNGSSQSSTGNNQAATVSKPNAPDSSQNPNGSIQNSNGSNQHSNGNNQAAEPAAPAGEVSGSNTPANNVTVRVANSDDIHGIINFIRSEIRFNYYLSEEEAKKVVEKINKNDFLGAALSIRNSVRNVLNDILLRNVENKVRIIHEAMPEMYLENYQDEQETRQRSSGRARGVSLNAGRPLLTDIVKKLVKKLSGLAYHAIADHLKARAAEFKQAQAQPEDGVTIKITWKNIPGMPAIRTIITAIKKNLSVGNITDLALPDIPAPEVQVTAGKKFD